MSSTNGVIERVGGIAGWLMAKLRPGQRAAPRLALLERIGLGPRQSLALVEAEGQTILVATSAEGGPAFYPLGESLRSAERTVRVGAHPPIRRGARSQSRVSW